MKSIFYTCVAGLALLSFPVAATAAGITYDCDTAADHFSELTLPTVGANFTVSGNVRLNAVARSKTYLALARIQIVSSAAPGQPPNAYAGFSLSAFPADGKKTSGAEAIQMLSYDLAGKDDEVIPTSAMTKLGTVQPFTLSYDGSNVTIVLGPETRVLPLKLVEPVARQLR